MGLNNEVNVWLNCLMLLGITVRLFTWIFLFLMCKTDYNSPKITFNEEKSHRQQTIPLFSMPFGPKYTAEAVEYHATITHLRGPWSRAAIPTARSVRKGLGVLYMGGHTCINNYYSGEGNNKGLPFLPKFSNTKFSVFENK